MRNSSRVSPGTLTLLTFLHDRCRDPDHSADRGTLASISGDFTDASAAFRLATIREVRCASGIAFRPRSQSRKRTPFVNCQK